MAQNDAWADDPDLRIVTDDDPDSVKVKAFLRRWGWPGVGGLAIAVVVAVVFKLAWAYDFLQASAVVWLVAQFIVRPGRFLQSVVGFFGKATSALASVGAPVVAKLNGKKGEPEAPAPQAVMAAAAAPQQDAPSPAPVSPPVQPKPPRKPVDWGARGMKLLDGLLNYWWLILIAIVAVLALNFLSSIRDWVDGPSGREVAAEYRADAADNRTRTSQAEADRSAESVVIVERHNERRSAVRDQTEEAREAIAEAPDLDAQYLEYRSNAERLRLDSGAAAAAAVSEYHSSLNP